MRILLRIAPIFCMLCSAACGDAKDTQTAEEDPAEHACEHVAEAGSSITAAADRAAAPEIAPSSEPYTVSLASGGPSFVKLSGGIDALLFTRASGVVSALYHEQESTNLLPSPAPNEVCPSEIPEHFDLVLEQSGSHYLELAQAVTPSVWLMLTSAGGHGH